MIQSGASPPAHRTILLVLQPQPRRHLESKMRTLQVPSIFAAALIASAGITAAQEKGMGDQPPAKQSAPSESTDAPGHDAQSGKPETAEKPNDQGRVDNRTDGTTPTTPQSPPTASMNPDTQKITLTEDQAKTWIDKPVFSSDEKELGEVAAFKRAIDNTVLEMHADIGGLFGIGETRISVTPAQFKLQNDRIVLTLTEEQANALPKVKN
jgi:hypothetical protein